MLNRLANSVIKDLSEKTTLDVYEPQNCNWQKVLSLQHDTNNLSVKSDCRDILIVHNLLST